MGIARRSLRNITVGSREGACSGLSGGRNEEGEAMSEC